MRLLHRATLLFAAAAALASGWFLIQNRERDALLDVLIAQATQGVPRADVDSTVLSLSRAIYAATNRAMPIGDLPLLERLEVTSGLNVGTSVALKYGIYGLVGEEGIGPCGTMTRILLNACWRLGIPARKLLLLEVPNRQIGHHTMVEFQSHGRWQVLSPSDNSFVWRSAEGRIATRDEIRADSAVFAQVFERYPRYPYRFDRTSNIRWEKLPLPVRRAFRAVLGERGYRLAETPRLYDQPRKLFLWTSLAVLACTLVMAMLTRRRDTA